jgi:superfamily II DNA or RNA helicase
MLKQGIYEEIINIQLINEINAIDQGNVIIDKDKIDNEEARKILSSYISRITRKALTMIRDNASGDNDSLLEQIKVCNQIIGILAQKLGEEEFNELKIAEQGEVLLSVYEKLNNVRAIRKVKELRPTTSIAESSLFTGSNYEPNMVSELKKEILTSDSIDMIVSFIKWSGLVCILEELSEFTSIEGNKLRVITTSYLEATDYKAIIELSKLNNTEIKISYDTERTRLHAKAYMFKRETGFSTAYIGSSNLSKPAITSGLEWNLKITEKDSFDIIKKFEATFESYWNDKEFRYFNANSDEDHSILKRALTKTKEMGESKKFNLNVDIRPYHYQKEILEKLEVEREIFARNKNLIVAATGVGKTIIAAFDYKRFKKTYNRARLLFVAHRKEILEQSLNTLRLVLQDFNFGDILVGEYEATNIEHLFISIQSFNSKKLHANQTKDFYDFIIIDEFHHAAANSYNQLLDYYEPKVMLGLTATPERMDGKNVLEHFEGKIASEMRLKEAIDRKLLSPFQYFCVADSVDLSKVKWSRKGYDSRDLENLYTDNKVRSIQVVKSLKKYVADISKVKGLGFCVSKEHAIYMAKFFNNCGIQSLALYANIDTQTRALAKSKLTNGEIKFIFVVDLYNEGVDIPEVNTVMFLRPTESLTVFLQQLGRGLRLTDDKECLTVLDFIGQANKNYSFEEKFRTLIGKTKHSVKHYVENGFFNLPKGCFIQMEKMAKDYVLRNIKEASTSKRNIVDKMRYFQEDAEQKLTIFNFTKYYHYTLYDVYGKSGNRCFYDMKKEAGVTEEFDVNVELIKKLPNLFHIDSLQFIKFIRDYLLGSFNSSDNSKIMLAMLYYTFFSQPPKKEGYLSFEDAIEKCIKANRIKDEILEILDYRLEQIDLINIENNYEFTCPLDIHCTYNTAQIMAAFGYYNEEKVPAFREGVKYFEDKNLDIFLINLNKSEKDFSPSTLYEDYALCINEKLFHWQSQSTTSLRSKTGQRYIRQREFNSKVSLFVREYKKYNGYTSPYIFLGNANYISHEGEKPISFVWELENEIPPALLAKANKSII